MKNSQLKIYWIISIFLININLFGDENITQPIVPNISVENSNITIPPIIPNISEENSNIVNQPTVPNISEENSNIVNQPTVPNVSEENSNIVNQPTVPNISEENSNIVNQPTIPNFSVETETFQKAPKTPEIIPENSQFVLRPDIPTIESVDIQIIANPVMPQIPDKQFNYIIGVVDLPENVSFEISFVDLGGIVTGANILDNGFWEIQFPLIKSDSFSKKFYIELRTVDRGVITDYFIDGETLKAIQKNRVEYEFNLEVGRYFPKINPIILNSNIENIGNIIVDDFDKYSTISGDIVDSSYINFVFEALNINSGEITLFENSNLGFNNFGFKLLKDEKYILSLNIIENDKVSESYFVNYKNGSSEIDLFSVNELDFNSSNIPQFDKYIEPKNDLNINLDLKNYYNSIYTLSGTVNVEKEENLTLTIFNAQNGRFIDEVLLNNFDIVSKSYNYNVQIGRNLLYTDLAIFLTKSAYTDIKYIYSLNDKKIVAFTDSDLIELEYGVLPNRDKYSPLKIVEQNTVLPLNLSEIKEYIIDGNISIPENLNLGLVCKYEEFIKYGQDCNSSMENLGFNYVSIEFKDENNNSDYVDLSDNSFLYKINSSKSIEMRVNIFKYSELENQMRFWNYSLTDLSNSKSITPFQENITYPKIKLDDINNSVSINIDLASLLDKRFSIAGAILKDDSIKELQISVLDSKTLNILGSSKIGDESKYFIELDKFSDSNSSNNGIIFELIFIKDNEQHILYFDKFSLSSTLKTITLLDDTYKYDFGLDLSSLLNNFENNLFKISGYIQSEENSSIFLEFIEKESGKLAEIIFIENKEDTNISFEAKIEESGNYIMSIYKNNLSFIYNPFQNQILNADSVEYIKSVITSNMIPNPSESGYFALNYSNREKTANIDLIEPFKNIMNISGVISNISVFEESKIIAYSYLGNWLGESEISLDGNYSIYLPNNKIGDEVIFKIISDKNSQSYYLGSNNVLIDSSLISENVESIDFGDLLNPLTIKSENINSFDIKEFIEFTESKKYKISGDVLGSDKNISLQLIDIENMVYLDSVDIVDNNYSLSIPNGGEFILYIQTSSKDFYYDFNNSKLISADKVKFININNFWIPDSKDSGSIVLDSVKNQKRADLDLSNIDNMFISLSGNITFPKDYLLGEECFIGEDIKYDEDCNSKDENYKFSSWKGSYITIFDKDTKDEVGFSFIESKGFSKGDDGIDYNFSITFDNSVGQKRDLIFEISIYENNSEISEYFKIFYNFQNSNIVNGKLVSGIDPEKTGWFSTSDSVNNLILDISSFKNYPKKITGNLITPLDFDIAHIGNSAEIFIYDAKSGKEVDSTNLKSDSNFSLYLGETDTNYNIAIKLNHFDDIYPTQNYERIFYLDFGETNSESNISILRFDEVSFIRKDGEKIPDINYLIVDKNISFNIEIKNDSGSEISGRILSDTNLSNISILFKDYRQDIQYFGIVFDGYFIIKDMVDGNYTINILTEDIHKNLESSFIKNNGFTKNSDIVWERFIRADNSLYQIPKDVKILEIKKDLNNFNINLGSFLDETENYSLTINIENEKIDYGELFIPNSSNLYYEDSKESDFIRFNSISPKSGYYLRLGIKGKEYFYNSETNELESGINWSGYNQYGTKMCPTPENSWNCDWDTSLNWIWKPDIISYDLSDVSPATNLITILPEESLISGVIKFGTNMSKIKFKVIIYQVDNEIYNEYDIFSNEFGDLNISLPVKPMEKYRVEIANTNNHYVLNINSSGNYETILNNQSWKSNVFGAVESSLINLDSSLDFGIINIESLNRVNINIDNIIDNEDVFIRLFNNEFSFEADNIEVSNNIHLDVYSGKYYMIMYASEHDSGYATENSNENNLTKFEWNYNLSVDINIQDNVENNFTVSLPDNNESKYISGTVILGDGDIESGWIEINSENQLRGAIVEDNGKYQISGLIPSKDSLYILKYTSWNFKNLLISKHIDNWNIGNLQNQDIVRSEYTYTISGNIKYSGDDLPVIKAMLIKQEEVSNIWSVIQITDIKNEKYIFEDLQPIDGIKYFVCAGVQIKTDFGSKYNKFSSTNGISNIANIEDNSTINLTFKRDSVSKQD